MAKRTISDGSEELAKAGRAIGLLVCLLLALYTGNKLRKMFAVRGWLPGARVEVKLITGKEELAGRHGPAYWIAWDDKSPAAIGDHRVNLDHDQWAALSVGENIEVRYLGNEPSPYLSNGIYASTGNVGFDLVLFVIEVAGAVFCALLLLKRNSS